MNNMWMLINTSKSIDEFRYVHRRARLGDKTMTSVTQLCHPKDAPNHRVLAQCPVQPRGAHFI